VNIVSNQHTLKNVPLFQ